SPHRAVKVSAAVCPQPVRADFRIPTVSVGQSIGRAASRRGRDGGGAQCYCRIGTLERWNIETMSMGPAARSGMARTGVMLPLLLTPAGQVAPATGELLSSRPITVVIPFTTGGSADTLQRIVNKKVSDLTGQILVVESRPGGGGTVGASAVKQAPPDGHTL